MKRLEAVWRGTSRLEISTKSHFVSGMASQSPPLSGLHKLKSQKNADFQISTAKSCPVGVKLFRLTLAGDTHGLDDSRFALLSFLAADAIDLQHGHLFHYFLVLLLLFLSLWAQSSSPSSRAIIKRQRQNCTRPRWSFNSLVQVCPLLVWVSASSFLFAEH